MYLFQNLIFVEITSHQISCQTKQTDESRSWHCYSHMPFRNPTVHSYGAVFNSVICNLIVIFTSVPRCCSDAVTQILLLHNNTTVLDVKHTHTHTSDDNRFGPSGRCFTNVFIFRGRMNKNLFLTPSLRLCHMFLMQVIFSIYDPSVRPGHWEGWCMDLYWFMCVCVWAQAC